MTEATVTQPLLKALKLYLPGAVIIKTCDRFTKGIPDIDITWREHAYRLEIKLLKPGDSFLKCSDALQQHTMRELWRETGHRAFYVVYDVRHQQRTTAMYTPDVFRLIGPHDEEMNHAELILGGLCHRSVAQFVRER